MGALFIKLLTSYWASPEIIWDMFKFTILFSFAFGDNLLPSSFKYVPFDTLKDLTKVPPLLSQFLFVDGCFYVFVLSSKMLVLGAILLNNSSI